MKLTPTQARIAASIADLAAVEGPMQRYVCTDCSHHCAIVAEQALDLAMDTRCYNCGAEQVLDA